MSDLTTAQRRAEADLEPVRERRARNQQRIDAGQVPDPKALAAMVEEVEHLGTRIAVLEDAELEVMEQLEEAQERRAELGRQAEALEAKLATYRAARDAKIADIDAEGRELVAERKRLAPGIGKDLLTLYDRVRTSQGSGAAALEQGRCSGCRIDVDAADLRRFAAAPADEVLRCGECGRILVRTARSGL
uniref:zinc ribbon domain-containing protein n=1 Tax=Auraticoccus cholistanensis TaxID=2656650 RepID=UPI0018D24776